MKPLKIKIVVNNKSIPLGFRELEQIATMLPDTDENADIFHELAKSKSSGVRTAIARKMYLSAETAGLLVQDDSVSVLCEIIKRDIGVVCLNLDLLAKFVELGSTRLLKTVIQELDYIVNEFDVCPMDYIMDLLIQNDDPAVRFEMAGCDFIPKCYLKILAGDPDVSVAMEAKRTLQDLD